MYKEEMSIKLLGRISLEYPDIDQNKLRNIIDEVVSNYRVEQEEKALVVQDDMQEKIWLYLSAKLTEGLSEKTLKEYKRELLRFSNYMRKDVDKISAMDIRLYLATITKERNLKNTSLGEVLFKLKSFFNWLASDGYISKSPTINIKQPKCEKKLRNALTEEQLEKLRDACDTLRSRALVELFFASGIRVGELHKLNIDDIDTNNMRILIKKGKGNKQRLAFFSPRTKVHLEKYLSSRTDDCDAVFVRTKTKDGRIGRLGVRSIEREIHDLGVAAGIGEHVFPHLLRHSFASSMVAHGADIFSVSNLLGHSYVSTTQVYVDVSKDKLQSEYNKHMVS